MATGVKAPALPVIRRRVRGGVPVYVVDGPAPARCALVFRVGRADESLLTGGVTHLIEHLALFQYGDTVFTFNGSVGAKTTIFSVEGTPDELVAYARDVTRALGDLPFDRMRKEKRVLDVEDLGYGVGPSTRLQRLRFGTASYGRRSKRPFGLPALERDAVERWRRRYFTKGNVAVWMTGEPPETLGLELPDGERMPAPVPEAMPALELPACVFRGEDFVALGLLGEDTPALDIVGDIARRRLYTSLRRERGLIYDVGHPTEAFGHGLMHAAFTVECKDEHAALVTGRLLATLNDLAGDGPTERELEFVAERARRDLSDRQALLDDLDNQAFDELLGIPPRSHAEWLEEVRALRPADCAAAVAQALPGAILELPRALHSDGPPAGFAIYAPEPPTQPRPEGPSFREKDETDCPQRPCEYTLGPDYFHLQPGDGSDPETVAWDDVVGVAGHAGNGHDLLIRDGRLFDISAWAYHDGEAFVAALRERIPAELWVPDGPAGRRLDELAARDVSQPELVVAELEAVADALREDEEPHALATDPHAGDDQKPGLVVVTSQRFCFVYRDPEDTSRDVWNQTPLDELEAIEAVRDDDGRACLRIRIGEEEYDIEGLESDAAAERIARAAGEARARAEA